MFRVDIADGFITIQREQYNYKLQKIDLLEFKEMFNLRYVYDNKHVYKGCNRCNRMLKIISKSSAYSSLFFPSL